MKISSLVMLVCVLALVPLVRAARGTDRPVRLPPIVEQVRMVAHEEEVPPGVATQAQQGLTLAEIERMALHYNPALAAAAARVDAARGNWVQVGLAPNPVVGYSGEEIGDDGTAGKQGAFVAQEFITSGKLRLNRAVAEQEIDRAEQDWSAWRERVMTDVRIGFYDALIAQRRLEMTRELLAAGESSLKVAEQLVEAKEKSRVDVLQAQVEANTTRIQFQKAQNAHAAAWRHLSAVIGRPDLSPQPISGNIEAARRDIAWEDALGRLLSESPEIAAAHAERYRAGWALDRAWAERVPNVDARVSVHKDNTTGDTVASVELGVPLPIHNRNQGGIAKAEAELAAAQHRVDQIELSLRQRLAVVYRRYSDARYEVDQYAKKIKPAAKESMELMSKSYRAGESNYLALLTAQRTYFQTNLAYIESLRNLWSASLEIDGLLLTGGLNER